MFLCFLLHNIFNHFHVAGSCDSPHQGNYLQCYIVCRRKEQGARTHPGDILMLVISGRSALILLLKLTGQ